jgi:hypothetical protein
LNCYIVVDCSTNEGLFYSRRIGRSPALRGAYGDATTATATPIAAAAKLTGRTSRGLSFGLLEAVTPEVLGTEERTVEPLTNFVLLRAQQDLRGGESGISFIATGVNRSLNEFTEPFMHDGAYTAGATFRHRFNQQQYELAGQVAGSRVTGTPAALLRTQTGGVHYYQQPGDELEVDSNATSLTGHSEQLKFGKYAGGITRFETSLVHQSAGFDVNDLGFLRRADKYDWSTWAALSWREARWIYRWAQLNGNHWETWNTSGTRLENAWNFNGHMGLNNNWDVHLGLLRSLHAWRAVAARVAWVLPVGRLQHRQPEDGERGHVGEPVVQRRGEFEWHESQPLHEFPAVDQPAGEPERQRQQGQEQLAVVWQLR